MEYEYRYNSLGLPVAEFSMGHEAIGRWISDELGRDLTKIEQLLAVIVKIEAGKLLEKTIIGVDLKLSINFDDVEVAPLFDSDEELPEETNLSEDESYASCGLPDFKQAIEEWLSFHL